MKLNYIGPVKQVFGLQIKDGSRIRVQPGQAFTIDDINGQHVLRRWSSLFEEVNEAKLQVEKATRAAKLTAAAEKPAKPAEPAEKTE